MSGAVEPDYAAEMHLPPGMACNDCRHFSRCKWLISCKPTNTSCDWWPSKFWQKAALSEPRIESAAGSAPGEGGE